MTPQQLKEFEEMKRELELLRNTFVITPTKLTIKKTVLVNGIINADRVYTKRTGNHVELTT